MKLWPSAELPKNDFAFLVRLRMTADRNPLLPLITDKLTAKTWALGRGVESAPVVWQGARAEDVPWDSLPQPCFIKTNHGSGWNLLVSDGQIVWYKDGRQAPELRKVLTRSEAVSLLNTWLGQQFSPLQWAYQPIPPRLLVEAPLKDRTESELQDYRFYTFNGRVVASNLGSPSLRRRRQAALWYRDGSQVQLTKGAEILVDRRVPDTWTALVGTAETLGQGIDFARVDLYDTAEGIRFGEMTVYPEAGGKDTPTACPVFNQWLAAHWTAPWVPSRFRRRAPAILRKRANQGRAATFPESKS